MIDRIYFFTALATTLVIALTADGSQPNVLLIVSEDNAQRSVAMVILTLEPQISIVLQKKAFFFAMYVPQAGCSQSRASFFTGLYPHQHGQIGLATWGFRFYHDTTPKSAAHLKIMAIEQG